MLKAADTLHKDGHAVRVVATRHEPWAVEADVDVASRRHWVATVVDYRRGDAPLTYWRSGIRYRGARAAAEALGPAKAPFPIAARAFSRVHDELVTAATSQPADFIYGGTTGALAAVAEAATRLKVPYAIDLEDLHHGESSEADAGFVHSLAGRVEEAVLPGAAFVTTSSDAIGAEYERRYGVRPETVHNTFPLPEDPPSFRRADSSILKVYWFSQTIGHGRGLEEAIDALGLADTPSELSLRGRAQPGYLEELTRRATSRAPRLRVLHLPPAPPDSMIDLAHGYDIGLATEPSEPLNRRLCVSNKILTYILAGLAVISSDLPGVRVVARDFGEGAELVPAGDVAALTDAFRHWAADPSGLERAKRAAWCAAVRRWRWDHPLESGRLRDLVRGVQA
jgi:glycosyltransferase involved in cell wall biosynthesis